MQFIDLPAQQKLIRDKIESNLIKVLDHGRYVCGPEIDELESKLADYVGTKYALGVSSGTDAILMPLMAYDIGPGDAVFCPSFTFVATAEVIKLLNAVPVFVDIDPNTYNIDVRKLEEAIHKIKTEGKYTPKGIIPVDLFGQLADYNEINDIATKHDLFVIEDAAQSFGAEYNNKKACSFGNAAATSFFPAKPLGGYGDGGMIFTNDKELYDKLVSIRIHGQGIDKYTNIRVGINGRLDTLQAAVLLAKFEIFDNEIIARQNIADYYSENLKSNFKVPFIKNKNLSAWAQYSIQHSDRDKILDKLKSANIPSAVYYQIPLHLQKAFSDLGYKKGDLPICEEISQTIFSLPMHPYLKKEDQNKICEVLNN